VTALAAKTLDLVALVKPRITTMAVLTAAGAMSLAGGIGTARAVWALAGVALIVGAANTLNMWLERDTDCLMTRTKNRPLPRHRLEPSTALVWGALQGAISLPVLAMAGIVPAALGLAALLLYVGVYTPMKQRTHWATWIGAIPGAMPALMGWTAATGRIELRGLAVFAVLLIWQVPHTHAIAIYRQRDYEAAGMKTMPTTHGLPRTRRSIATWLVVQVAVSLAVYALGIAGLPYAIVATAFGAVVLAHGLSGFRTGDAKWARQIFLLSICYLPVLFATMVLA